MNKNILLLILFTPIILGIVYAFYGSRIPSSFLNLLNNTKIETTKPIDLEVLNSSFNIKTIQNSMQTDDEKGLGYTGQNKIAIDSKGNTYITYRQKQNGKYEIFVAKFDKNNEAIFNKQITEIKSAQRVSSIAIDYRDTIHIVWYGIDSIEELLGRQIKYSHSSDGGETFSKPLNIGPVEGYKSEDYWQEHPQISTYKNNLFIVWEGKDTNNENQQIKFASSANSGKTWSTWRNIYPTAGNAQSRPSIVVDSTQNLHLFFYSNFGEESPQIKYSSSDNAGKTWTNPVKISNNSNESKNDSRHVSAAYLKDKIIAVWREGPKDNDQGPSQIYYSILDITKGKWTEAQKVAKSSNYQFFPAITTNGATAVIAFMEN